MGTIRRDWRELRSLAVVMLLIAGVSATTVISCGGGGGDSNGELCQQCGDSDGACRDAVEVTDEDLPSFCETGKPCTARLRCLRKLDSAQRRCFPVDPVTNALDILYRCDGARPDPDDAPTTTPTPTPTFTPSPSATPTSTGPTATGLTATPTGLTPTPTATPVEVTVRLTIGVEDVSAFLGIVTATLTYPPSKGDFLLEGDTDCSAGAEDVSAVDNGSGTLTLTFSADVDRTFPIEPECVFYQEAGQTLDRSDLSASVIPSSLPVVIEPVE